MTRLVLHIDRLVLHGVDRGEAARVVAGLQQELRRLLAQPGAQGVWTGRGDAARCRLGEVRVPHGDGATGLGRAVAQRLLRGSAR